MLKHVKKMDRGLLQNYLKNQLKASTHEIIIIDGVRSIHEINVLKAGNVKLLLVDKTWTQDSIFYVNVKIRTIH